MPGSCGTKGIWIWDQPIVTNHEFDVLLADCQGLNDEESNPEVDIKLLALSLLLSSTFIFNTIGLISDSSLSHLSIM